MAIEIKCDETLVFDVAVWRLVWAGFTLLSIHTRFNSIKQLDNLMIMNEIHIVWTLGMVSFLVNISN